MAVAEGTIRKDIFDTIYGYLNDNKLTDWTILSSFPEVNPTFPCIVINPANISIQKLSLTGDRRTNVITVVFEFFSLARDGKKAIDEGRDNIQKTLQDNSSTMQSTDGLLYQNLEDGDSDMFEYNDQKINYANCTARFKL